MFEKHPFKQIDGANKNIALWMKKLSKAKVKD
jgi:hypothetical protein